MTIRLGPVGAPAELAGRSSPVGDRTAFRRAESGRYRIAGRTRDHRRSQCRATAERNIRLFLLGSAFGALLHQRGLLPAPRQRGRDRGQGRRVHGAVRAKANRRWPPGSTTRSSHPRRRRMRGRFRQIGTAVCSSGPARLRLWAQALARMGRDTRSFDHSYLGDEPLDKFDVPIGGAGAARSNMPLAGLYRLERGEEFSIKRLERNRRSRGGVREHLSGYVRVCDQWTDGSLAVCSSPGAGNAGLFRNSQMEPCGARRAMFAAA